MLLFSFTWISSLICNNPQDRLIPWQAPEITTVSLASSQSCCRRLYNWLKVSPYRPDQQVEEDDDLMDESQGKGIRVLGVAFAPGRYVRLFLLCPALHWPYAHLTLALDSSYTGLIHSAYTDFTLTLYLLYTDFTLTLHWPYTQLTLTLKSHYSYLTLTLHSPYTYLTLTTLLSLLVEIQIILYSPPFGRKEPKVISAVNVFSLQPKNYLPSMFSNGTKMQLKTLNMRIWH